MRLRGCYFFTHRLQTKPPAGSRASIRRSLPDNDAAVSTANIPAVRSPAALHKAARNSLFSQQHTYD